MAEVNAGKVPSRADIEKRLKDARQASAAPKATAAAAPTAAVQSAPTQTFTGDAYGAAIEVAENYSGEPKDLLSLLKDIDPAEFLKELKAAIEALDA